MSTNKIYTFAENSNHTLTDEEYELDAQRKTGNQPGIARGKLVNKALKQSTLMAASLAQFIADSCNVDIDDSMTPKELASLLIKAQRIPGEIAMFCFQAPPKGWLLADGRTVSRSEYSLLYAAIGNTFGAGDGKSTFNLPDLRGEFIRGLDNGRGIDPNRQLGSYQKPTYITGEAGDGYPSVQCPGDITTVNGDRNFDSYADLVNHSPATASQYIGSGYWVAVRPRNIALAMFIFSGVLAQTI